MFGSSRRKADPPDPEESAPGDGSGEAVDALSAARDDIARLEAEAQEVEAKATQARERMERLEAARVAEEEARTLEAAAAESARQAAEARKRVAALSGGVSGGADTAVAVSDDTGEDADDTVTDTDTDDADSTSTDVRRRSRLRRIGSGVASGTRGGVVALTRPPVAVAAAAVVVVVGLASLAGFLVVDHLDVRHDADLRGEALAAARQGVVDLTSIDHTKADADVARIVDNSTGGFRDDFQKRSGAFVSVVQDSQVSTAGTVTGVGVESVSDSSAVALVAATSKVTNSAGAQDQPRMWRLRVTLTRDQGVYKMSRVDFVP